LEHIGQESAGDDGIIDDQDVHTQGSFSSGLFTLSGNVPVEMRKAERSELEKLPAA